MAKWAWVKTKPHNIGNLEDPENWEYEKIEGVFIPMERLKKVDKNRLHDSLLTHSV